MNVKTTAVIVDDEQPICDEIEYLVGKHIDVAVAAKFTNCVDALSYILEQKPDVVFLDIKMPGMSGLELAQKLNVLKRPPYIIFITAFEDYAMEAFDTPAIGYLTKPVTEEKIAKALNKIRSLAVDSTPVKSSPANKVCVLFNGKIVPVDKREIVFVYVKDKDVSVRTKTGEYSSLMTLQEFEQILADGNFLRVHRQYIVNLDEVLEIIPWFHGAYLLRMNDSEKQEIPVSRNKVKQLKAAMGFK